MLTIRENNTKSNITNNIQPSQLSDLFQNVVTHKGHQLMCPQTRLNLTINFCHFL